MQKTILEKSTNTHTTHSEVIEVAKYDTMTTIILDTKKGMIVEHGHHNTVATSPTTTRVIKITQQEFNPLLRAFQNAYD